jgi:hypothetical protein
VRVRVRRNREVGGVKLVGGMVTGNPDVVVAVGLQDSCPEFVQARVVLGGFHLVDEFSFVIGSYIVFAGLEYVDVERDIAVRDVEGEVDQAGLRLLKGELEPLEALEHGGIAVFAAGRGVGALVGGAVDGLSELEGLRRLPGSVGGGGDDSRVFCGEIWGLQDLL